MTGKCVCNNRWTGPNCDQKTCPGKPPCTDPNQGKCNDNPNNPTFPLLTCACLEAWTGESCSEKTCPGKNSEGHSNPCSGHGTCEDNNVCSCTDTYKGDDCSEEKVATNPTTEVPTITTSTKTTENSTTESTTESTTDPTNSTTEVPRITTSTNTKENSTTETTTETPIECTNDCFNDGQCNTIEGKCDCKANYDSKPDCSGMLGIYFYRL